MVEIALQWSPSEVSQWLEAIGLPMYCHAFLEHEISGSELMALEKSDFKDAGVIKVGHIKKLQKGIRDIQSGKMPRRLLHATSGVTTSISNPSAVSAARLSPKPTSSIYDDDDSFSATENLREESFG